MQWKTILEWRLTSVESWIFMQTLFCNRVLHFELEIKDIYPSIHTPTQKIDRSNSILLI